VSVVPSDEQVRALAAEILRRTEYARWRTPGWLAAFLRRLAHLSDDSPPLYWSLVAALLVLAVLLIVHVTTAIRSAFAVPTPAEPARAESARRRFVDEAEDLAAAGRFLEAARRLQLAVIELLLSRRVVTLARSEPNRILRARLREARLPEAECRDLLALIDRFERSWFRDRSGDRSLYEAWREALDRLAEPHPA